MLVEGPYVRYSVTAPGPQWGGPTLGYDTLWALEHILGYDQERILELVVSDALR